MKHILWRSLCFWLGLCHCRVPERRGGCAAGCSVHHTLQSDSAGGAVETHKTENTHTDTHMIEYKTWVVFIFLYLGDRTHDMLLADKVNAVRSLRESGLMHCANALHSLPRPWWPRWPRSSLATGSWRTASCTVSAVWRWSPASCLCAGWASVLLSGWYWPSVWPSATSPVSGASSSWQSQ